MGKGGLSFLNKKSWHTATIANTEKVWLAEQKDAAEKAKLAQLQKEIAEERQVEELRALQRQHGVGQKPVERLDWMYRSAEIEAEIKQKEKEEFLLGKPIPAGHLAPEPAKPAGVAAISDNGTERWVKKYEQRDLDAETRIREDPMLLILKQEQEQRLSILKNPLQMKRIREEIDKKKLLKKLKKMEKEEKKKEKKMKKKKKDKSGSPERSASPTRSVSREAPPTEADKYGLIHPRTSHAVNRRLRSHHDDDDDRDHHRRRSNDGHHHRHRSTSPRRSHDDGYSRRRRSHERNRSRSNSRSRRRRDSVDRDGSPHRKRHHDARRSDRSRDKSRSRSRSPSRERRHRSRSPRSERGRARSQSQAEDADASKDTQKLRLMALKSRIGARLQRTKDVASSSSSNLTREEREARLKAMMNDAQDQHEIRSKQLAIDIELQKKEEEALRLRDSESGLKADFIQKLNKKAFMESTDTVEDRIKQRVHYRQKGSTEYHSFL